MDTLKNVIVLDGVSASGKSTIASKLAVELDYSLFDSGSLYRSFCFYLRHNAIELIPRSVFLALQEFHPEILHDGRILLNNQDINFELHTPQIDEIVPLIGSAFFVRHRIRSMQRLFCENMQGRVIMTGRDVGTEVIPESRYKFFITASAEVRAYRRAHQGTEGVDQNLLISTQQALISRDTKDASRKVSPMTIPDDALVIDTSKLTIAQTLSRIKEEINLRKVSVEGPIQKGSERR